MIACAEPTQWPYSPTVTVTYAGTYGATATATTFATPIERNTPYVVYSYANDYDSAPAKTPEREFETERHRRWRLSLEAIGRHRRAARRIRLRVVSQWQRPVSVARTCSQAERWRVSH
jgi:hypothetical protein